MISNKITPQEYLSNAMRPIKYDRENISLPFIPIHGLITGTRRDYINIINYQYYNRKTPFNCFILFWPTGTGKTSGSIYGAILMDPRKIVVVCCNKSQGDVFKKAFRNEYIKKRFPHFTVDRLRIYTYSYLSYVVNMYLNMKTPNSYYIMKSFVKKIFSNTVVIFDEIHNITGTDSCYNILQLSFLGPLI